MRVTTKGARAFFLLMLTVLAILGIYQCFTMANAFNISPYTKKLRQGDAATNFAFIRNDTLFCDSMIVTAVNVLKAIALQADTLRGANTVVGITDDTLIVDADSTGSAVTIRFGRWGGGLRWNRATDAMQYSNDFSTWTAIGTGGSSTTNADSLDGVLAHVRPLTDGYYLRYDADGDSLYLSGASGATDEDSTFVAHYSSRWRPLSDSAAQYIGDTGDSTVIRIIGASTTSNADDTIISFCKIYYGEAVVDSALVTYGTLEAAVAALGSGDITGVITSGDWLEGGASSGDVALNIKAIYEDAYQVIEDTTAIEGTAIKLRQPTGYSSVTMVDQAITLQNGSSGSIVLNVDGTPTNTDEMTITENNIEIRSAGSNGVLYLSGYDLERVQFGAIGTMFVGAGTSTAPAFTSIHSILDTLFAVGDAAGDTMWANTPGYATKANVHDSIYAGGFATKANVHDSVYAPGFATKANVHDSVYAPGFLTKVELKDSINATKTHSGAWTLTGDWVNTTNPWADNEVVNALTVDDAGIASTITRDAELEDSLDAYLIASAIVSLVEDSLDMYYDTTKSVARIREIIEDSLDNYYDTTQIVLRIKQIVRDSLFNNSNNFFKTAGNGLTSSTSTINVVAGANGLTVNADSIYIDTTKVLRTKNIIANWITPWPDSVQGIGSGGGLTISSSITLGTDITDDTTVVDFYPEPSNVVLANSLMPQYNDSIKIYGVIDSLLGNTLHFRDSTLNTHGLRRRGFQMTVSHPMRVDSLRYVIVEGLVKDSSASNEMYLKGMLRTTTFTTSCLDSNAAANVKDYDSLGGDWGDVAAIRRFVLTGGAVTPGTPWYLLITARHDAGTAWNWAEVWRIRFIYSRTRL